MKFLVYLLATVLAPLSLLSACGPAACATCAAPRRPKTWYIDPVNGHDSNALISAGDGSAGNPWKTLGEVISSGNIATAPTNIIYAGHKTCSARCIQSGDTILLLSGAHGSVNIQGYHGSKPPTLVGFDNGASPIIIQAAPGATPVLTSLTLNGGNGWTFRGLTFESENTTGRYVYAGARYAEVAQLVTLKGPHANITLDQNTLKSRDTAYTTIADWQMKRSSGINELGGVNIAITNNTLRYVGFGISAGLDSNVTITGNTIDYFTDDAIDYGGNTMLIAGNTITNSVEDGDGFHRDAIQGQPANEQTTLSNISILNNVFVRDQDPANPFPGPAQGIDDFDGTQVNFTVTGNQINNTASNAITFYGINGGTISGNVIVRDTGRTLNCVNLQLAACQAVKVTYDTTSLPGILAHGSKLGSPPSNVVVDGNTSPSIGVSKDAVNVTVKNNLCHLNLSRCVLGIIVGGAYSYYTKSGTYPINNALKP